MSGCIQNCQLACAACKIICFKVCCQCFSVKRVVKSEFDVLALGLSGVGKSTILSKLCNESTEDIQPTAGFSIKDVALPLSILHVKEIGGTEKLRQYWHNYFDGADGLIFVIDGSAEEEEFNVAQSELRKAVSHPSLHGIPVLVLLSKVTANQGDVVDKMTSFISSLVPSEISSFIVDCCSLENFDSVKVSLEKFSGLLDEQRSAHERAIAQAKGDNTGGSRI